VNGGPAWLVIMGVSGCGKSTLGRALAQRAGLAFVEGDDFHAPQSVLKMRSGIPLDDADRADWLDRLGQQLVAHESGAVLSCSALKQRYRNQLAAAVCGLKFVYLQIDISDARARVGQRGDHIFPVRLVDNQFAVLEPPTPGPDVLELSAVEPLPWLCQRTLEWLGHSV
jgi:gluconokinase